MHSACVGVHMHRIPKPDTCNLNPKPRKQVQENRKAMSKVLEDAEIAHIFAPATRSLVVHRCAHTYMYTHTHTHTHT